MTRLFLHTDFFEVFSFFFGSKFPDCRGPTSKCIFGGFETLKICYFSDYFSVPIGDSLRTPIHSIYHGTFFFTVTLFSPENRYRLGDLFFVVLARFFVLEPLFQKRADLNVPPTFGSDSFWCWVGSCFGSVFFMFFLNFFRERRSPYPRATSCETYG